MNGQRVLGAALALAGALALLPSSWMAPWSPELAVVLTKPLQPAAHGLAWIRDWLRPPAQPYAGLSPDTARVAAERDALQGELDRERIRAAALESQLRELRVVVDADTRGGWRPVLASVIERPSGRRKLLGIDAGTSQGLVEGDPVVAGGNRLVGRIIAPVDGGHSWVVPADDARIGRIDALVYPATKVGGPAREATMIQLVPVGGGRLRGELERAAAVQPGDVVLLSDATWKNAAQGMRLGVVERSGALDSNPLRTAIDVRMDLDPTRVGGVTVKVADPNAPARTGAAPASGGASPGAPTGPTPTGGKRSGGGK